MESILNDVMLEENRLLLEQLEEMTMLLANLPKQLMEMQESSFNRKKEHVAYMWRQEPESFYSPPPSHQPPEQDRNTKLEETLIQFMQISMENQRNTEASIKNLEIQMGLLAEQMANRENDKLVANNEDGVEGEEEEQSEKIDSVQKEDEKEADDEVTPEISIDHQNTGMDSCVEHVDFVFGDQLDNHALPSSKHVSSFILNLKSVHIFVHTNQFICEFDVIKRVANELGWSEKIKKKKVFLLTWKGFEIKLNEKQVKRPKKRKGLYYNPCLWSP